MKKRIQFMARLKSEHDRDRLKAQAECAGLDQTDYLSFLLDLGEAKRGGEDVALEAYRSRFIRAPRTDEVQP
jgi:hypothetical protein